MPDPRNMARQNPYGRADHRTLQARARGYPARSVFKLEEIDRRCRLFSPGQRVIDLGAAPGSWSLYAAERVGERGVVIAIDLQPITHPLPASVTVLQADALALDSAVHSQHGPYQVVLSDMAPKTGGDKFANAVRSFELFRAALEVSVVHGVAGCHFVGKLFMGPDFEAARAEVAHNFAQVKVVRPSGTRGNSVEVFLVGLRRRAADREAGSGA